MMNIPRGFLQDFLSCHIFIEVWDIFLQSNRSWEGINPPVKVQMAPKLRDTLPCMIGTCLDYVCTGSHEAKYFIPPWLPQNNTLMNLRTSLFLIFE